MGIEGKKLYDFKSEKYAFKKNTSGLVFNTTIYTDNYGFRVPKLYYSYDKDKKSVIFFGDSVTFGNGVKEEKTFVGLLRNKFTKFNFYNLSLPGYNIENYYNNFSLLDEIKNLERVFYIYTLNDIYDKANINYYNLEKKNNTTTFITKLKQNKILYNLNFWLRNKSYLYLYLKGILTDPSSRWFKYDYNLYSNEQLLINLENFIEQFNSKVKSKNTELLVIILPYEFQTRVGFCKTEFLIPQTKVATVLDKKNIKYFDLTNLFCNQKKPKDLFYKFDPMHLSKEGHQLILNFFLNEIYN